MIALIVAVSQNGVIGKDGKIPWRLPTDLARFKRLTMDGVLIMGRRTYETTLVLTRRPLPPLSCEPPVWESSLEVGLEPSLDAALNWCRRFAPERPVFICGGADVYREAVERDLVDKVYVTHIEADFEGDTRFPYGAERLICPPRFRCVSQEPHPPGAAFPHRFWFFDYERVR